MSNDPENDFHRSEDPVDDDQSGWAMLYIVRPIGWILHKLGIVKTTN